MLTLDLTRILLSNTTNYSVSGWLNKASSKRCILNISEWTNSTLDSRKPNVYLNELSKNIS